jgi:L-cysteine desulfidase
VRFSDFLSEEMKPALGCTEPACIAWAAARAASLAAGEVRSVDVVCDARIYKNCYAVGIPHSGHRTGILWAAAIGALLPEPGLGLECFRRIDAKVLEGAGRLVEAGRVRVEVDAGRDGLFVDCRVRRGAGEARAVVERDHTRLVRLERNGAPVDAGRPAESAGTSSVREEVSRMGFPDLVGLARSISEEDRRRLREGMALNLAIANHGLSLFPKSFVDLARTDALTRLSRLVCAGVYARMWGEDFTVMTLAGSGNKGIVCAVPLALYAEDLGLPPAQAEEALALAALVTSSTTAHLGTLSAVCGCSNAAGIGLAAGLVCLMGGGAEGISRAVNNMVGNVTGMICDGAKIGCALKTMTAVDAAFRSASLALEGIGIPFSDGIVGAGGMESLRNLGRIATRGMDSADREILAIMRETRGG